MAGPQLAVPIGRLWLRALGRKDKLELRCFLGQVEPKVVGGAYGGWTLVERPGRRSLTEWVGTEPMLIQIDLLIDHYIENDGTTTEAEIRSLERMAGLDSPGSQVPPLLHWDANAPHDNHEADQSAWVIESIEWGDALRNENGNRVRQQATVQLRLFVEDTYLKTGAEKNKSKKTVPLLSGNPLSPHITITYKVKKGDTLKKIAAKYLNNGNRYTEIAKLNNIRDPNKIKVNQVLKIQIT